MLPSDLAKQSDITFLYDGTLEGFYCCVYEAVYSHSIPMAIEPANAAQPCLFLHKTISTSQERAKRVRDSIPQKISPFTLETVEIVFHSCLEEKELKLLNYLLLGYRIGNRMDRMLGHSVIAPILAAKKHLLRECHLFTGFVRFADHEGVLVSVISPKNNVLPYLAPHFCTRFREETFMIYDNIHKLALIYENHRPSLLSVEDYILPDLSDEELLYQSLWKRFYKTVSIEERHNPKCRMSHMPKRYWKNMLEVKDEL